VVVVAEVPVAEVPAAETVEVVLGVVNVADVATNNQVLFAFRLENRKSKSPSSSLFKEYKYRSLQTRHPAESVRAGINHNALFGRLRNISA